MSIQVAPSILSADFGRLKEQVELVEQAGADIIHIDVMDGHFVPNLTYGPIILSTCRQLTDLPIDVHLMVSNAEETLDMYINAGADMISVHQEATTHLQRTLDYLRQKGVKAGVALNPATPADTLHWVAPDLDFVLVMTVNPGFEAQQFIPQSMDKIRETRALLDQWGSPAEIEVDGGIGPSNAVAVVRSGAQILVAGSAIYKADDPATAIKQMKKAGELDIA